MLIASLPMYDRPEIRGATDRLWQGIRDRLGMGPKNLCREGDPWDHWTSPDLLLSQTCGFPYRSRLHGRVTLVGTPDLALPGCPPGQYCSAFVVGADDPRGDVRDYAQARLAYNDALSQSGWAAPQAYAAAHGFAFAHPVCTGAHAASARAVTEGRADIAALDALSWVLVQRHDSFAAGLREIARTPPTPALPWITAHGRDPEPIAQAIHAAILGLAPKDRHALGLRGLARVPATDYLAVANPPPPTPETA